MTFIIYKIPHDHVSCTMTEVHGIEVTVHGVCLNKRNDMPLIWVGTAKYYDMSAFTGS